MVVVVGSVVKRQTMSDKKIFKMANIKNKLSWLTNMHAHDVSQLNG